ncbi:DNA N-6-adenine-methyltransferase [Dulcicalothrix desertica]|nr:DNA N-6-adenine-methyltransferase [Dulcicalothrix desertica]
MKDKSSDNWYTPPYIVELVVQVLGEIDLDPCAEVGKKIPAREHYTINEDGLFQQWHGRIFLNPPYSCPGKWIAKLIEELASCRVTEAIALVPGATDTNWLSPVLKTQPVCFWKGRIKFLDTNYEPKLPARQSHVLIYWGRDSARFIEVFDAYGVVQLPNTILSKLLEAPSNNKSDIFQGHKTNTNVSPIPTEVPEFQGDKTDINISPWKSDEPEFQGDKSDINISPWKSDEPEFQGDKTDMNISPIPTEAPEFQGDKTDMNISPIPTEAPEFQGDKSDMNISPWKNGEPKFQGDKTGINISASSCRRTKGNGSGSIRWRTVIRKGKEYYEAYYHYEFWSSGEREIKSTKYIPKRLLSQVLSLDSQKAPVREILKVLGVVV